MQKFNSDPIFNAVHYELPEPCDERVKRPKAIKEPYEISKTDWCEDVTLSGEYFAYRDIFINMLTVESMWQGHLG